MRPRCLVCKHSPVEHCTGPCINCDCLGFQYPSPLTTKERRALLAHAKRARFGLCPLDLFGWKWNDVNPDERCYRIAESLAYDGTDGP